VFFFFFSLESAFDELMAHAKHQGAQQPSSKHTAPSKPKPATSGWAGVLGQYCISPEKHPDLVVTYDDKVVVIKGISFLLNVATHSTSDPINSLANTM